MDLSGLRAQKGLDGKSSAQLMEHLDTVDDQNRKICTSIMVL